MKPLGYRSNYCEVVIWKMRIFWSALPLCSFTFCHFSHQVTDVHDGGALRGQKKVREKKRGEVEKMVIHD